MATRLLGPADPDERLLLEQLIEEREATERDRATSELDLTATALGLSRQQGPQDVTDAIGAG